MFFLILSILLLLLVPYYTCPVNESNGESLYLLNCRDSGQLRVPHQVGVKRSTFCEATLHIEHFCVDTTIYQSVLSQIDNNPTHQNLRLARLSCFHACTNSRTTAGAGARVSM